MAYGVWSGKLDSNSCHTPYAIHRTPRARAVIVETVVSTLDQAGQANFAAMGVVWGDERITIRPYTNTRTYRNLTQSGEAVVNVTDNVLIFAKSALSRERFESLPARHVKGLILKDTCFWREVTVEQVHPPTGE